MPPTISDKEVSNEVVPVRSYCLDYKSGQKVWHKHFWFNGNLPEAIKRGREHCTRMGYWFVNVSPFLVDLDIQERDYNQSRANGD